MPVLLGQFVGALVPTFLLSRLLLWLTKRWDGGRGRYFTIHFGSLLIAALIGGMGRADGGAFAPIEAAGVYAIPQVIWLIVDLVRFNMKSHATLQRVAPAKPKNQATDAEVVFWQSIKDSSNVDDFAAYLQQFPDGVFTALARNRFAALGGRTEDQPLLAAAQQPKSSTPKPTSTWLVWLALGAFGVVICIVVLIPGFVSFTASNAEIERERTKYDRWLNESRAQTAAYQAQLEERARQFDQATAEARLVRSLLEFANSAEFRAFPTITMGADDPETLAHLEREVVERSRRLRGLLLAANAPITELPRDTNTPLVPEAFIDYVRETGIDAEVAEQATQVAARIGEYRLLSALVARTPLGSPVESDPLVITAYGATGTHLGRLGVHYGVDIEDAAGTTVLSTAPGVVAFAGERPSLGLTVEIDHGFGYKTRYANLRSIDVVNGDRVANGQRIGSTAASDQRSAAYLHYEIWHRGRVLNPTGLLSVSRDHVRD
jgi:murein DD-endopeptidase MepM/ murein hydrolase activator NlpD